MINRNDMYDLGRQSTAALNGEMNYKTSQLSKEYINIWQWY